MNQTQPDENRNTDQLPTRKNFTKRPCLFSSLSLPYARGIELSSQPHLLQAAEASGLISVEGEGKINFGSSSFKFKNK